MGTPPGESLLLNIFCPPRRHPTSLAYNKKVLPVTSVSLTRNKDNTGITGRYWILRRS